jgi:transketolase
MPEVLKAADILGERGVSAEVVSFHTVKPLDEDYLGQACGRFKLLATIEEHGRIGGLGGAVAEWRAPRSDAPVQISFGTADEFMHEVGSQDYARAKFGLTGVSIANKVLAAMSAH